MSSILDRKTGGPRWDLSPGRRTIEASFAPNGAGAIDATKNRGDLGYWSVAWVSTGLFRITMADSCQAIDKVTYGLQLAAAADRKLQIGAIAGAPGVATIDIRCVDSTGTVQDIAADANNRVHLDITVRGSTLKA